MINISTFFENNQLGKFLIVKGTDEWYITVGNFKVDYMSFKSLNMAMLACLYIEHYGDICFDETQEFCVSLQSLERKKFMKAVVLAQYLRDSTYPKNLRMPSFLLDI